jgi:hypothetical protein
MKEFLRCLLLPLENKTLIVPYSAIAEIIAYDKVEINKRTSESKREELTWRGLKIPVISLFPFAKTKKPPLASAVKNQANLYIAVFNRIDPLAAVDFVAVILHAVPIMQRYKRQDFKFVNQPLEPYLLMEVQVRQQTAFIPNIQWLTEQANSH